MKPTFPTEPKAVMSGDGGADRLRLTPLEPGLLLDRPFREGLRFEAIVRDPNAAFDRKVDSPIRPVLNEPSSRLATALSAIQH